MQMTVSQGLVRFLKDVRAFGAHVERVEQPSRLVQAISAAFLANKTALLDVVCPIEGI
jgi:thiamine pyrophosphate-dependent acetolactate synthase large subunit-like protein